MDIVIHLIINQSTLYSAYMYRQTLDLGGALSIMQKQQRQHHHRHSQQHRGAAIIFGARGSSARDRGTVNYARMMMSLRWGWQGAEDEAAVLYICIRWWWFCRRDGSHIIMFTHISITKPSSLSSNNKCNRHSLCCWSFLVYKLR